ncbi:hypothetical protein GW17_00010706 [Ensete ventricosum]|nr:hypothetical protein GW17_00010706 [Ensete ventricosum]
MFAISTCTARYGRYISVRQVTGTWNARYRVVSSKIGRRRPILEEIDCRRSIEEEEERKKKEGNKEYLASAVVARGRFFSRTRRQIEATLIEKRTKCPSLEKRSKCPSLLQVDWLLFSMVVAVAVAEGGWRSRYVFYNTAQIVAVALL